MMEQAYLAQISAVPSFPLPPLDAPKGLDALLNVASLRLFASASVPRQTSPYGTILGRIYSRQTMEPVAALSPQDWAVIAETKGQALIDQFWGDYVAFLTESDGDTNAYVRIIRAPFGRLGCYWIRDGPTITVTSHPGLLTDTGVSQLQIDPLALARHIAQPEMAQDLTCLHGLHSLAGGNRLNLERERPSVDKLWSPWHHCNDRLGVASIEHAGEVLRQVLIASVAAQTQDYRQIVLMLSGGFDSSALAACLQQAKHPFQAITLVTQSAMGDERHFAQLAAQATGAQLMEAYRTLGGVDLAISAAARGARPFARAFTQESDRLVGLFADKQGADAVIDGGSGDNLFFNYMSLAALVEVFRHNSLGKRFWQLSTAFADLTGASIASVVARTIHRAVTRDNSLRIEKRDHFLTPDLRTVLNHLPLHPWQEPPATMGAGKAAHVALLMPTQANVEQGPPLDGLRPRFSPFVCQPIVETVLSLPIWCWFAPGHNRAAARTAFAQNLPPELINRRTKGTPAPFMHELYFKNRPRIRCMLLDGRLAGLGILDLDAVRTMIDAVGPTRDFRYSLIMDLVDAEVWARSWD